MNYIFEYMNKDTWGRGGGGDGGVLRRWVRWKIEEWLRRRIYTFVVHSHAHIISNPSYCAYFLFALFPNNNRAIQSFFWAIWYAKDQIVCLLSKWLEKLEL